jgi:hypothetical protein
MHRYRQPQLLRIAIPGSRDDGERNKHRSTRQVTCSEPVGFDAVIWHRLI